MDFEAAGGFLAAASQRSTSTDFRTESSMAMEVEGRGQDLSVDATLMTGELAGGSHEFHLDIGSAAEHG